jgi:hypothetical protein
MADLHMGCAVHIRRSIVWALGFVIDIQHTSFALFAGGVS